MGRRISILSLVLIVHLDVNCGDKSTNKTGDLPENITLNYGQSMELKDLGFKIGFDSVLIESRCPFGDDIYCLWQGFAQVRLWVLKGNHDTLFVTPSIEGLLTASPAGIFPPVKIYDYQLTLERLTPHPQSPMPDSLTLPADYTAEIKIDKIQADSLTPVTITDLHPAQIQKDPFNLEGFSVIGDTAIIIASFGGGCRDHTFELFMSPAAFMESEPVQAGLYLRHEANGDACDALITRTLKFDLSPIGEYYLQAYHGGGQIRLNLHEFIICEPVGVLTTDYFMEP